MKAGIDFRERDCFWLLKRAREKRGSGEKMERFGATLRQLREDSGMTQKEFASLFDVNRATIGHYESNASYPTADVLVKMANYFHISVDQLLGRECSGQSLFDGLTEEQIDSLEAIVRQFRILNQRVSES